MAADIATDVEGTTDQIDVDRRGQLPVLPHLRSEGTALPAWPLQLLLFGFPVFWALGALPFVYVAVALVMTVLMVQKRDIALIPGLGFFFAFLVWALASSVVVEGGGQVVGYLWRFADLVALGAIMLYYANARESLDQAKVTSGLVTIWLTTVVLGVAAIFFPEVRLSTPVGQALPAGLTSNPLVNELVFPRLAEVQQPWGAPEPYNRPAAPFPYANSWGVAYVLLMPVVFAFLAGRRPVAVKALLVVALAVSVWPAIETSNRGMFLGLGLTLAYVVGRWMLQGRLWPALVTLVAGAAGGVAIFLSGAAAEILGRQEYSNSTSTRENVYKGTLDAVLESPLLGWGNPRTDESIGIALGTQGFFWTLMFCFGFVGLALFMAFLLNAILRTSRIGSAEGIWLHSVPVTAAVIILFYGLGTTQLLVVCLVVVTLLRKTVGREIVT